MISSTLSSNLLIHFSVSSILLLIPSHVFFISVIVFFIFTWLISLYFLTLCSRLLTSCYVHAFFSWVLWSSLQSLPWALSKVNCLSPLHLVLLGFWHVSSFGTCSSATSFFLTCRFHFYISVRLITLPSLGEVTFVGDIQCSKQYVSL